MSHGMMTTSPSDYDREAERLLPAKLSAQDVRTRRIHAEWNKMATEHDLPLCRAITPARLAKINARIRESSLGEFIQAIHSIPNAGFLLGKNDRGWRADFDFLLQARSYVRVIEGFYDRINFQPPAVQAQQRSAKLARETVNRTLGGVMNRRTATGGN